MPQRAENSSRSSRRRPGRWLAIVFALIALGAVPSLIWEVVSREGGSPVGHADPRYASQSGDGARAAHIRSAGDHTIDTAIETCEALGVAGLAHRFGMDLDPAPLARRFAADYEPAFRRRAYRACLRGLRGES